MLTALALDPPGQGPVIRHLLAVTVALVALVVIVVIALFGVALALVIVVIMPGVGVARLGAAAHHERPHEQGGHQHLTFLHCLSFLVLALCVSATDRAAGQISLPTTASSRAWAP